MGVPKLPNYGFHYFLGSYYLLHMNSKSKKFKGNNAIPTKTFSIKYQVFQFDLIPKKFEEDVGDNTIW
jgi:hypothetical protein